MRVLSRAVRVLSLVVLAIAGTIVLTYCAPGYFSDVREMDSTHSSLVRNDLDSMRAQQASLHALLRSEMVALLHGDIGESRHYGVPVASLIKERARVSAMLLGAGVFGGWCFALIFALPLSITRHPISAIAVAVVSTPLLAIPVGVLATVCMVSDTGGPVSVLAVIVGLRDFRLLYRLLKEAWQGLSTSQVVVAHFVSSLKRELLSMLVLSFTLALSALVPIEVVFDKPGLGQLAWSAAMNRDLPVLVAVTAMMAAAIGLAGAFAEPGRAMETSQCA